MATMEISAKDVFKLRKQTGAGMMDCKKALIEAEGDFEKATDVLRKTGQKLANKRADRDATEGYVLAFSGKGKASIVVLNCETDFVALNDDFGNLVTKFAEAASSSNASSLDELKAASFEGLTVGEKVIEQTGVVGEKLDLSYFESVQGEKVIIYNHPGNRIASIVAFNKDTTDEIAKDVAMQVAAMNPVALSKDDCPQEVIDKELEIAIDLLKQEGKPEQLIEKIAQGKLNKFFKDNTLLNQGFIKDSKISIQQYLNESDKELTVIAFKRYALGE
ncbi:MAG: elongation factor Ts [Saprospiraceae bacterium]|jgi:elongation factor Ts